MALKHNMTNITERCRICLTDCGCMISLLDESVEDKLKDLVKCTCIDVKHEENLPGSVCHVCLYKLNLWNEFKKQFIKSNKVLLEQLEASEEPDNIKDFLRNDEIQAVDVIRRKRSNLSSEHSGSDCNEKKKAKTDSSLTKLTLNEIDTICISNDENDPTLIEDSPNKTLNAADSNNLKENYDEEKTESKSAVGMKTRLLSGRRGRAIERRKASTKRWVERKKALLAATGENISDTDSVISDDAQMSPVQKARAKTNADKEAERQKRIAKLLKNMETNLTEKCITLSSDQINMKETDSDTQKTESNKELQSNDTQESNKDSLPKEDDKQEDEKNIVSLSQEEHVEKVDTQVLTIETNNVIGDHAYKTESCVDDTVKLTPHTIKSELMIGNVTYFVTSTLSFMEAPHSNKDDSNNLNNDSKNFNADENSQDNTDIIDAVQLRRIHPVPSNSKKSERCLNIDVESTEYDALKHIQIEVADFVENEMKHKLFDTNGDAQQLYRKKIVSGDSYRKLDQKLKNIIERAIISNIESSLMRDVAASTVFDQQSTRVSRAFVKIAKNLPKYQPLVMMKRLDLAKEGKLYKINNANAFKQAPPRKLAGPFSVMSRKRQSVRPIRYNDYNTSAMDSDSEESSELVQETPKMLNVPNIRTYANLATKQTVIGNNQIAIIKRVDNLSGKTADNNVTAVSLLAGQNLKTITSEQKPDYEDAIKIEEAIVENHICGVCGLSFNSRKDVETHVRSHKFTENNVATPRQTQKQKMMRCKRCQEVVEARFVKAHVCKKVQQHKCYVCFSIFRTEKLLVRHLGSHDKSEFKIENIAKIESKSSNGDASLKPKRVAMSEQDQRIEMKTQNVLSEKNDIQSDKITSTGVKLDGVAEKFKETYTCFVCDKIFTDEEILKDHLQKHCDDLSEGEQSNNKEQYQCAICGDTLESDQALEEHVGKHLFDDEDDNPNLISIGGQENEKTKSYQCGQCSRMFDSEVSLEMHMQAHEEDAAIKEWEKKDANVCPYECMLCGDYIETEENLTEHLSVVHNIRNSEAQICQLCDKPFNTLEELQEHVGTH